MPRDILVRKVSDEDIRRADELREHWPSDISRSEALRIAITRGLDVLLEAREWWRCPLDASNSDPLK